MRAHVSRPAGTLVGFNADGLDCRSPPIIFCRQKLTELRWIEDFNNQITTNIKIIHEIDTDFEISKIFTNKSASILIDKNFIDKYIIGSVDLSYIEIIANLNISSVREIIYNHYIQWHKDYLKKSASENPDKFFDPKYHEIYIPAPIDEINIILIQNKNVDSINDNTTFFLPKINYKFRISSHYLPHDFEFFQIKYEEFFSTVSQFHLPIVRAYYDGNQIYLLPSCITACLTLINIDWKYFTGRKDPIEIINKYRLRGFGTILNEKQITKLIEYSNLVSKWKKLYKLNIHSNSSILNTIGILDVSNLFFRPSLILDDKQQTTNYVNFIINTDYNIIPIDVNDIFLLIKKIYKITNNLKCQYLTINKNGYVNPIKKWLINAFDDIEYH